MQSECSCSSYPSQSLWSKGVLQPHFHGLGVLQWCLVYGQLLVGLLMRETEVGNNLCCHLDNVTPFLKKWDCFLLIEFSY